MSYSRTNDLLLHFIEKACERSEAATMELEEETSDVWNRFMRCETERFDGRGSVVEYELCQKRWEKALEAIQTHPQVTRWNLFIDRIIARSNRDQEE